jgi:hypothetical protein
VAAFALIVVFVALMVGLGALLLRRGAGSEGANVDVVFDSQPTFDAEFREAAASVTPPQVAHSQPEPAGDPPVAGAQWDEVAGRWIHWDPTSNTWVPVEPG